MYDFILPNANTGTFIAFHPRKLTKDEDGLGYICISDTYSLLAWLKMRQFYRHYQAESRLLYSVTYWQSI